MKEQHCIGDFCPVFLNLRRPGLVVGLLEHIKIAPCKAEFFASLVRIGEVAKAGGERVRKMLAV